MEKTPLEAWIFEKIGLTTCKDHSIIDSYQLEKLKENIAYVKEKSIFYREYLKEFSPEFIKSFEDFEALPFTDAENIKTNAYQFLCVSQQYINRIVSLNTSGTTGTSKRIFFTEEDQELTIDFFKVGMSTLTQKGDRVLILLPGEIPGSVGDLLKKGLARIDVEAVIYGPIKDYDHAAQSIIDENINALVGIPIQVLNLKRKHRNMFHNIKRILLSTDYVPEAVIKELSSEECRVFTHYGMTEMGLGGGVECSALNGYHMREADLYFEIINPQTGAAVKDGNYGEIVFTTLTRKGMPLIRYRTGDIVRFVDKPCSCGTVLKTMERVKGRLENSINIFEDVFLTMRELDEVLLKRKEIFNYEASINSEKLCDSIIIKLQMNKRIFEEISKSLYKELSEISGINEALKRERIKLILEFDEGYMDTGSGVHKRKIHDYRKVKGKNEE